jgi:hypothetical protein
VLGVSTVSEVPPYIFAMPFVAIGLMVFWLVAGKRMMASTDRHYAAFRVGDVAQRMGLQIIDGDPSLNLIQAQTKHNMAKSQATGGKVARLLGDSDKETRVRMQGAPYGRPTELVFYSYTKYQDRLAVGIITKSFEFRLSVQIPVAVPSFEIVLRKSGAYGLKARPEWRLPRQSFGDPDLDARLSLTTTDARLGPYLAPAVGGLIGYKYLHIQGDGHMISSLAEENATMLAAFDLEQTQLVLEHMASALGGPVGRM